MILDLYVCNVYTLFIPYLFYLRLVLILKIEQYPSELLVLLEAQQRKNLITMI